MPASRRLAVVLVVLLLTAACGGAGSALTTTTTSARHHDDGEHHQHQPATTTTTSTTPPDTGPLAGLLADPVADPFGATGHHPMAYGDETRSFVVSQDTLTADGGRLTLAPFDPAAGDHGHRRRPDPARGLDRPERRARGAPGHRPLRPRRGRLEPVRDHRRRLHPGLPGDHHRLPGPAHHRARLDCPSPPPSSTGPAGPLLTRVGGLRLRERRRGLRRRDRVHLHRHPGLRDHLRRRGAAARATRATT